MFELLLSTQTFIFQTKIQMKAKGKTVKSSERSTHRVVICSKPRKKSEADQSAATPTFRRPITFRLPPHKVGVKGWRVGWLSRKNSTILHLWSEFSGKWRFYFGVNVLLNLFWKKLLRRLGVNTGMRGYGGGWYGDSSRSQEDICLLSVFKKCWQQPN